MLTHAGKPFTFGAGNVARSTCSGSRLFPCVSWPERDDHGPGGGRASGGRPFPPLQDDPNGILALPAGFSYRIVTHEGATDLSSGQGKRPAYHDGTGVVASSYGKLTIIQNHEMTPRAPAVRESA